MKIKKIIILIGLIILIAAVYVFKKNQKNSSFDKLSYALGYQVGKNIKNSAIRIDLDTFTQAIYDGYENKKAVVKHEEIQLLTQGLMSEQTELAKQIMRLPWVLLEIPAAPIQGNGNRPDGNRPDGNRPNRKDTK